MGGWQLTKSVWANPFSSKEYGREGSTCKYKQWIVQQPELIEKLASLANQTLGFWCSPEPCHGFILQDLYVIHVLGGSVHYT